MLSVVCRDNLHVYKFLLCDVAPGTYDTQCGKSKRSEEGRGHVAAEMEDCTSITHPPAVRRYRIRPSDKKHTRYV